MLTFFGIERAKDEAPVDVWPLGLAPFIRLAEDGSGNKVVDDGIFGLLPHFAELAAGRKTYNAKSETVAKLPSFRESWSKGWRCIIPVESFYEPNWETGKAVRWLIQQPGEVPMGLAGIYRKWRHPDGREQLTFAMLTINADGHPVMQRFHKPGDEKRMVVILDPKDYGEWLSCPVKEAPKFFKQWTGPLEAFAAPLPPRAPKASSVRTVRVLPPEDPGLF
ncbi:MAG: SOS response-associated peptidase family protein [Polaromonas sp.]|nr:SOS response-associated peptidase family protein [Polaromonas sp.]MDI1238663.1 SOS response-associated peptidase family protein [Polaromonas sp.]